MEKHQLIFCTISSFLLSLALSPCLGQILDAVSNDVGVGSDDNSQQLQAYIVHVEKPAQMVFGTAEERADWHKSFLPSLTLDSGKPRLIYSYEKAISGFAALLTPTDVEAMENMDGFLGAHLAAPVETRTTHSQHFLGLDTIPGGLWDLANKGEGMVIGVLDNGIDPSHPSFDDAGMPPAPPAWRLRPCRFRNVTHRCNNRVISAVAYDWQSPSPVVDDRKLHGTMVSSCAAGSPVPGANYHGVAAGTAWGAAPRAHIAFYVARDSADILMAYDQAICNGVDVLSVSQGYAVSQHYYMDEYVIGGLSAVENGIFVSVAAGNIGPDRGSILDTAPWTLSVGASSMDRVIEASIILGDNSQVLGESLFPPNGSFPTTPYPLVYPGAAKAEYVKDCRSFGGVDVKGKVVMCLASEKINGDRIRVCNAENAGAAAVLLMLQRTGSPGTSETICVGNTICIAAGWCNIPTVRVSFQDSNILTAYATGATPVNLTATISFTGTRLGVRPNPRVASFSSRGPSSINNGVLKPDILGPGLNILIAAPWSSSYGSFDMQSGTSLACPHLSGIAAMLKKSHPTWSPAAIKSAIITTADVLDNRGRPITDETGSRANLFATGAGQVNPTKANDPGLVYDIKLGDYTRYVCGLGYSTTEVAKVLRRTVDCAVEGSISGEELNYPSFSVSLNRGATKTVNRTVTNVQQQGPASYFISVGPIMGVRVEVQPQQLHFHTVGETRNFTVTFTPTTPGVVPGTTADGHLRWVDVGGAHVVRSPIVVSFT